MNNTQVTIEKIRWLVIDSDATPATISKETGIPITTIYGIRKEESSINNLTLAAAKKLEDYASEIGEYASELEEELRLEKIGMKSFSSAIKEFNNSPFAAQLNWYRNGEGHLRTDIVEPFPVEDHIVTLYSKKGINSSETPQIVVGPLHRLFLLRYAELLKQDFNYDEIKQQLIEERFPASFMQ